MRRRYLLILLVPLALLLALGAIPSLIGGGDVYYVVASEPTAADSPAETIDMGNLSENRFPYTMGAIDDGVSSAYEEGRFGFEESFTHSPFDEFDEFQAWNSGATEPDADVAWVEDDGTIYRLEITDDPDTDED